MKASLRSVRIAPKKANLVASMVRGLPVLEALESLKHTPKKGARLLQDLLESALANAEHNDKQKPENLIVKTIIVNKAQHYRRGVPMARGRQRPIQKFLSHIDLTLGLASGEEPATTAKKVSAKKSAETASQGAKKTAQSPRKKSEKGAPAKASKAKTGTAASDSASARAASPDKSDSASARTSSSSSK
jgi:large subunit ribosomal protein L22